MKIRLDDVIVIAGALVVLCVLASAIAFKIATWGECRIDHSWFYCWHLIG
jgi:hypothetical protein